MIFVMDTTQLIQQYLPQDLHQLAATFTIPDAFLTQMPDIIELVLRSKSMEKPEEKQSWFTMLPMMNDEQIEKLRDILVREKQKLQAIEQKYEEKKLEIKKKYLLKRQNMWYAKKVDSIRSEESVHRQQELEEADALLDGL